ncbi:MAG: hypothetical protein IJD70_05905 [Clostridia bacterium]|nr:hypothetical protein [Clostridia bacterium]
MKKYSYSAMKLFVSQMAISVFGLGLAIACASIGSTMQIVSSCGAVVFYLFLIYTSMWEVGSKDKFGIEYGKFEAKPLTGLYIALLANSLNFLLAIIIAVCKTFPDGGVISAIGGVAGSIAIFIEGMYSGILAIKIGELPLNSFGISYFVITIPAIITSALAYYFGTKGYHFTKLMVPENPEEAEIRREKKKARNKEE